MTIASPGPLAGIRVVDLSTLLPGPLAGLILAEAGAEVLKIEPPGGDPILRLDGGWGEAAHDLFNAGKRVIRLDLKSLAGQADLRREIGRADVLIEQFRPGVMARLGFGYATVRGWNPRLVYCSITGYGQGGPLAAAPGHDLNYLAEAGLLDGAERVPPLLAADVGGGTYPALVNILLALIERQRTGQGRHLDIAMAEMVRAFVFPYLPALMAGCDPQAGGLLGGSPRYGLYPTADGRRLAVGALEPPFWAAFCAVIDLPPDLRDDARDPAATRAAVAERIARRSAAEWETAFAGTDACVRVVRTPVEALAGLNRYPVPLDRGFRMQGQMEGKGA